MRIQDLATKPFPRTGVLKASTWKAIKVSDSVRHIYHYNALMAEVSGDTLTQVGEGWGSMSDKCGMARLRRAFA